MRIIIPAGLLAAALMSAQPTTQSMRANIRGGSGDQGKCTIEVEVDGVADVEIRGDMGWIRTLQGQPSSWRRFECTSALPRNPGNFRFKGVDGRGRTELVRDPNSTGGTAVVRIEDSKGGREGYTFDLEWRGGSGYGYTNDRYGYGTDRYGNDRYGYGTDRYGNRDRYGSGTLDPEYDTRYPRNRDRDVYGYSSAYNQSVRTCEDAVRDRVSRDYGERNLRFLSADVQSDRGNRDRVLGSVEGRRGEVYDYSCTVKTNNNRIQNIDVRRR